MDLSECQQYYYMAPVGKEKGMVPQDNSPALLSSIGLLSHPNYKMYFVLVPKAPLH
jgi:hypothetical protein